MFCSGQAGAQTKEPFIRAAQSSGHHQGTPAYQEQPAFIGILDQADNMCTVITNAAYMSSSCKETRSSQNLNAAAAEKGSQQRMV